MICALLIFDGSKFAQPLSRISPWLDMLTRPLAEVVARPRSADAIAGSSRPTPRSTVCRGTTTSRTSMSAATRATSRSRWPTTCRTWISRSSSAAGVDRGRRRRRQAAADLAFRAGRHRRATRTAERSRSLLDVDPESGAADGGDLESAADRQTSRGVLERARARQRRDVALRRSEVGSRGSDPQRSQNSSRYQSQRTVGPSSSKPRPSSRSAGTPKRSRPMPTWRCGTTAPSSSTAARAGSGERCSTTTTAVATTSTSRRSSNPTSRPGSTTELDRAYTPRQPTRSRATTGMMRVVFCSYSSKPGYRSACSANSRSRSAPLSTVAFTS